jgi:hypothetical protein
MKNFSREIFGLLIVFILPGLCSQAQENKSPTDLPRIAGTWKLNISKSKFNPGPPPKSLTIMWEWRGDALTHSEEGVSSNGERTTAHFTAKFDGKLYPIFAGANDQTPLRYVRLKKIDAYTMEATNSKDGKDMSTYRHVLSKDGKSDIITQVGKDVLEQGTNVTDVLVYERQ